jgi:ferredoxin
MGKKCVEVDKTSKTSWISEVLCIGCGICVKQCPFDAISIINLPKSLERDTTHRYGPNSFKLHRLPMPRPGQVRSLPFRLLFVCMFVFSFLSFLFLSFVSFFLFVSDTLATLQRPRGLEGTPDSGPSVPTIIAFREVTALELPAYRLVDRYGLSSHQRWT